MENQKLDKLCRKLWYLHICGSWRNTFKQC